MQYKNTKTGLIFDGSPIQIDGENRIWSNSSIGNSYPYGDCIPVLKPGCYTYSVGHYHHIWNSDGEIIYSGNSLDDIFNVFLNNNAVSLGFSSFAYMVND